MEEVWWHECGRWCAGVEAGGYRGASMQARRVARVHAGWRHGGGGACAGGGGELAACAGCRRAQEGRGGACVGVGVSVSGGGGEAVQGPPEGPAGWWWRCAGGGGAVGRNVGWWCRCLRVRGCAWWRRRCLQVVQRGVCGLCLGGRWWCIAGGSGCRRGYTGLAVAFGLGVRGVG